MLSVPVPSRFSGFAHAADPCEEESTEARTKVEGDFYHAWFSLGTVAVAFAYVLVPEGLGRAYMGLGLSRSCNWPAL